MISTLCSEKCFQTIALRMAKALHFFLVIFYYSVRLRIVSTVSVLYVEDRFSGALIKELSKDLNPH